jgi:hypothetical protein
LTRDFASPGFADHSLLKFIVVPASARLLFEIVNENTNSPEGSGPWIGISRVPPACNTHAPFLFYSQVEELRLDGSDELAVLHSRCHYVRTEHHDGV